jgi:pyruvate,orthophosphate dikinase
MSKVKRVYSFGNKTAEGKADMKNLLGGKGAILAEMCLLGLPVPAGFTITTDAAWSIMTTIAPSRELMLKYGQQ